MIRISRIYKFESAHHLPNHKGKCKNVHGHGFKVQVIMSGVRIKDQNSEEFGMLIDFKHLDNIIKPIIDFYDHKVLNDIHPNPTAENLARNIALGIKSSENLFPANVFLDKIRLWESENSYAEWSKEFML